MDKNVTQSQELSHDTTTQIAGGSQVPDVATFPVAPLSPRLIEAYSPKERVYITTAMRETGGNFNFL